MAVGGPLFTHPECETDMDPTPHSAPSHYRHQSFTLPGLPPPVPTRFATPQLGRTIHPSRRRSPAPRILANLSTLAILRLSRVPQAPGLRSRRSRRYDSGRNSASLGVEQFSDTNKSPSTPTSYTRRGVPSRLRHVAQELMDRWALLSAKSPPRATSSIIMDKVKQAVESISGDYATHTRTKRA